MQELAKSDLRENTQALPRVGGTNAVIVLYFLFSVHFQGASSIFFNRTLRTLSCHSFYQEV